MFKTCHHKNILKKTFEKVWFALSIEIILCTNSSFILNNNFVEEKIKIKLALFFFFFFKKKTRPKIEKKITLILISMRLLIFLVFSQYDLVCKYGIMGCRIAFSDTWCNNWQSDKAVTETWFNLLSLSMKDACSFFIFEVHFVLKITNS